MFIPVTLLGNDPDPIVHWYLTSYPIVEHVNVAVCLGSTRCDDGCVVNIGALTIINMSCKFTARFGYSGNFQIIKYGNRDCSKKKEQESNKPAHAC